MNLLAWLALWCWMAAAAVVVQKCIDHLAKARGQYRSKQVASARVVPGWKTYQVMAYEYQSGPVQCDTRFETVISLIGLRLLFFGRGSIVVYAW